MIIIEDKLVSDDLVQKKFVCNLDKCKGACCWEGDYGAPLEDDEIALLEKYLPNFLDTLTSEGKEIIIEKGFYTKYSEKKFEGTSLRPDGACVFLLTENGIGQCGIEKAYNEGLIPFQKPVSCHLYPVRVNVDPHTGITLLNYDQWDICDAACALGEELKVPVYTFVKAALIRKYGEDFYDQLDGAARHLQND